MKNNCDNNVKLLYFFSISITVLLLMLLIGPLPGIIPQAHAVAPSVPPKVLRVGWYEYSGFNMKDETGYRSGYNYDYLQEMARYGGWRYEYVESTVAECFKMLEDGRIDLMGSVMYTPERKASMDFSSLNMGRNFTVLTVRAEDSRYRLNDYASFDGIVIGTLETDTRLKWLTKYAQKHDFSYRIAEYETPALMEQALQTQEVDAILTTSMRVATNRERIIAQFSPIDFYFVTKKGNTRTMDAINSTMEQIEFSRKGFQAELAQKYFSVDHSASLAFTEEESAYILSHPVLHVTIPSVRKPIAYCQNGEYRGIVVDILNAIGNRIGITFDYTIINNQTEGIKIIQAGKSDLISHTYTAYGWAEINHMLLSHPFLRLDYVSVFRSGYDPNRADAKIAAVRGYRFSQDYVLRHYNKALITWYDNEEECIQAVQRDDQDICFVSSYVANEYLQDYQYRNLYSSIINYSHGLSCGLSATGSPLLLSVLDKAIDSMGEAQIGNIIVSNTIHKERALSLSELLLRYPLQFFGIFGVFSVIVISLGAMLVISRCNRKKNSELYRAKLAAERDSLTGLYNRLSFELLVDEALTGRRSSTAAFVMLDVDDFKKINDTQGHSQGDKILMALATELGTMLSPNALLGRMGGDEFAIYLPEINFPKQTLAELRSAQQTLSKEHCDGVAIACSMGVAFAPTHGNNFFSLYEAADAALYTAKRGGKGMVHAAD